MGENWDITTGDGSVSLYLPTGFGAELDAHTGDGSIRKSWTSRTSRGATADRSSRTLRGKIGDGGKLLRVRTGDGAITLKAALIGSRRHRGGGAAYRVGSPTPASRNASRRSRHLLHRPQCMPSDRLHARQRQLERHAQRTPQRDHVRFVHRRERRLDRDRRTPGRATARAPSRRRTRGVASGNGLPASGPMQHARRAACARHVHRRLRQQDELRPSR